MHSFTRKAAAVLGAGTLALGIAASASATAGAANGPATGPATTVPGCEQGCTQRFAFDLGNGYTFSGLTSDANPYQDDFATLRHNGEPVSTTRLGDVPGAAIDALEHGSCSVHDGAASCIVTGGAGAHSEAAQLFTVDVHNGTARVTDSVLHGSPGARTADLDGDGTVDIAMRESTYEPDYASAPQYWVGYLTRAGKLVRTGCTAPSTDPQPAPTGPLSGSCYA